MRVDYAFGFDYDYEHAHEHGNMNVRAKETQEHGYANQEETAHGGARTARAS